MASKKGIVLTIGILAVITAASFLVWFIPENREATFVVTDFENHLDGVHEIHLIIDENVEAEFENLIKGEITPEEYNQVAEVSSSQTNSQLIQLVRTQPPEEWSQSYASYIESLKHFNTYLRETIIISKMIESGSTENELKEDIEKIDQYRSKMLEMIELSKNSRP